MNFFRNLRFVGLFAFIFGVLLSSLASEYQSSAYYFQKNGVYKLIYSGIFVILISYPVNFFLFKLDIFYNKLGKLILHLQTFIYFLISLLIVLEVVILPPRIYFNSDYFYVGGPKEIVSIISSIRMHDFRILLSVQVIVVLLALINLLWLRAREEQGRSKLIELRRSKRKGKLKSLLVLLVLQVSVGCIFEFKEKDPRTRYSLKENVGVYRKIKIKLKDKKKEGKEVVLWFVSSSALPKLYEIYPKTSYEYLLGKYRESTRFYIKGNRIFYNDSELGTVEDNSFEIINITDQKKTFSFEGGHYCGSSLSHRKTPHLPHFDGAFSKDSQSVYWRNFNVVPIVKACDELGFLYRKKDSFYTNKIDEKGRFLKNLAEVTIFPSNNIHRSEKDLSVSDISTNFCELSPIANLMKNKVKYVENNKGKKSGYFKFKGKVYYKIPWGDYVQVFSADHDSFVYVAPGVARDKFAVYNGGRKISFIDASSYQYINSIYSKDKKFVYYYNKILDEADPNTFTLIDVKGRYAKDKKKVFYKNKILSGANPSGFSIIRKENSEWISKDKKHVFYGEKLINGADPDTFVKVDRLSPFYRDKYRFYFKEKSIKVDFGSYKLLSRLIIKDNSSVYYGNVKLKFLNPSKVVVYKSKGFYSVEYITDDKHVYFQKDHIKDIDRDTFKFLFKNFARDKNNLYCDGRVVEGVDIETVKVNKQYEFSDELSIEDKINRYYSRRCQQSKKSK